MGLGVFFPTDPDLADIFGRMDLDFICFCFFWIPNFWISRFPDFQNLAWAGLGPGLGLGPGCAGKVSNEKPTSHPHPQSPSLARDSKKEAHDSKKVLPRGPKKRPMTLEKIGLGVQKSSPWLLKKIGLGVPKSSP